MISVLERQKISGLEEQVANLKQELSVVYRSSWWRIMKRLHLR